MAKVVKIVRVVGTRPQLMQVKPLSLKLAEQRFDEVLVHTGQHYSENMSGDHIKSLGISKVHHNLHVGSGAHGEMFGKMFPKLEALYKDVKPDMVLADGDTNSTFAAILAAQRIGIPTVHVESGLRDFDRTRPEEINRILSDHTADLNCAPIPRAMENLKLENLEHNSVLCGDLLLDNFLLAEDKANDSVVKQLYASNPPEYYAMTLHRPENTDMEQYDRFCDIMEMIQYIETDVVFPIHPRTLPILKRYEENFDRPKNLKIIDPINHPQMIALIESSIGVITDSGGLPREAVWLGKKAFMLSRIETWHDMVNAKLAVVGNGNKEELKAQADFMIKESQPNKVFARELFGNGEASQNIIDAIRAKFG